MKITDDKTLITGKENIQTTRVWLFNMLSCWYTSVVGYLSHQTFIEKRSTGQQIKSIVSLFLAWTVFALSPEQFDVRFLGLKKI